MDKVYQVVSSYFNGEQHRLVEGTFATRKSAEDFIKAKRAYGDSPKIVEVEVSGG